MGEGGDPPLALFRVGSVVYGRCARTASWIVRVLRFDPQTVARSAEVK
jgi:hypothetical protein